ncbi:MULTISPECIES: glycosyltransferase 87 family protein [Frankia]|uniref:glycosyltransferase 87 family protein n=1 Tax=Frankia TaxID=1854 RepID=UPI001F0256AB|nr:MULTISPECIES: glycosyltransferase 87 family protein [Frankia]
MRADQSALSGGPAGLPAPEPTAAAGAAATSRTGPGAPLPAARRLWGGWLLTRALLVAGVLTGQTFGAQQTVLGDLRIYAGWAHDLGHGGGLPVGDDRWQYPPGAAVALVLPELAHTLSAVPYRVAFVVLTLLADLAVTVALARRDRGAALFWVVGITALGPVALARFDLLPAAAALAAVLAVSRARFGRAGFHLGVGTLLKVWPLLLLVAMPAPAGSPGRWPAWLRAGAARLVGGVAGAVGLLAVVAALTGWWRDVLGFLGAQQARGLQVEAVAATPFVVAHMLGGPAPEYSYGSLQFDGPVARAVATACSLVEAVAIIAAAVWWWTRGRSPAETGTARTVAATLAGRALALVVVVVVTARVLSPQYLVWILALVAAGLAVGSPAVSVRGRLPVALLACVALTQLIYPWRYNDVIQGRIVLSLLLVGRNLGLLMVCWWAVRAAAGPPPVRLRPRRRARRP